MSGTVHPTPAGRAPAGARSIADGERTSLRVWPLRKPAMKALGTSFVLLLAVWSAAGLLFMWLLDSGPVGDLDRDAARWLEEHRTERLDRWAEIGSGFSDTLVKVILAALVGAVMVAVWKRWHDAVYIAVLLVFEASVFALSSFIVGRERPPVVQLEDAAPSGSFPSGHSAAAVAFYVGLFVVFGWHTRHRLVRAVFGTIAVVVPVVVATARTYMGMHHVTDVLAGMALGAISIVVVRRAMRIGVDDIRRDDDASMLPRRVLYLDLVTPESPRSGSTTANTHRRQP